MFDAARRFYAPSVHVFSKGLAVYRGRQRSGPFRFWIERLGMFIDVKAPRAFGSSCDMVFLFVIGFWL